MCSKMSISIKWPNVSYPPFSIKIIEPILRYRNKKDFDHIRRRLVTFFNSNKKEGKFWQPLGRLTFCRAQWTKVTAYPIIWWCVCVVSFYTCDHFHKSYYILITPDLEIQVCCGRSKQKGCVAINNIGGESS